MTLTRRQALSTLALGGMSLASRPRLSLAQTPAPSGPFTLPPLPYPAEALEPHIDAQTMTIHHDRHHQAYVTNLNTALAKAPDLAKKPIEEILRNLDAIPEAIRTAVRNNGGGHANHVQFWTLMGPKAGGAPTGAIADALTSTFGSFDKFKELFNQAGATRFGSGWAWLSEEKGKLIVHSTANQDTPLSEGRRPIFGLDVWEHAYYLKYQNRRADYVAAWWNVVNWDFVKEQFQKA
jgi:superoxide dismutase, Fe-Mn family